MGAGQGEGERVEWGEGGGNNLDVVLITFRTFPLYNLCPVDFLQNTTII